MLEDLPPTVFYPVDMLLSSYCCSTVPNNLPQSANTNFRGCVLAANPYGQKVLLKQPIDFCRLSMRLTQYSAPVMMFGLDSRDADS